MMKINEHMTATQLKNIINERKHLSLIRSEVLLRELEEYVKDITPPRTFEESCFTFHTNGTVFYATGRSVFSSMYQAVFLNKNFIVGVSIRCCHPNSVTLDFKKNSNKPTEQDKKEVFNQLFDIIENADIFLLEDMTRDNTTIEFVY